MLAGQADCQSLSPFAVSDVGPAAAQSLSRQRNALPEGLALIGEHRFHAGSSEGAELNESAPPATRRAGGGLGRGNSLPLLFRGRFQDFHIEAACRPGPTMTNRLEDRISWRSAAVAKSGKSLFTIPHSHSRYCCAHRPKTTSHTDIRCSKFGCGVRLRGGRILAKPVRLHDRVPAPRLPLAPQQHLAHHAERTLDLSLIRSSPFES